MVFNLQDFNQLKGMRMVHMNVRSMVNKFSELKLFLATNSPDVLILSETWAHEGYPESFFSVTHYNHWRYDRQAMRPNGKPKQGGGLCIYVHEKYDVTKISDDQASISCEDIELFWLQINIKQTRPIILGALYRPPNGNLCNALEVVSDKLDILSRLKNPDIFLLGDFNLNYSDKNSVGYKRLKLLEREFSLSQHISEQTRVTSNTKTLIDLCLSNSQIVQQAGTLNYNISDHLPIFCVRKKERPVKDSAIFHGRSYRKYDREKLTQSLHNLDWAPYYRLIDPAQCW